MIGGGAAAQYTALSNQIQYRICRSGKEQRKIAAGTFVWLQLGASGKMTALSGERYWLKIDDEPRRNSLHNLLRHLSVGDSVQIVMPYSLLLESMVNLPRLDAIQPKEKVTFTIKILRTESPDIAYDKDYDKFCQQQEQYSQRYVQQYLRNSSVFEKRKNGIYVRTLRTGSGKRTTKTGSVLLVAYTGRFLNGMKFDNTPSNGAFRYVRGVQFQMIQGIAMMLEEMTEGSKLQIIIPSKLAFGPKGLADIVPPFAPVVYDIELLKIE